MADSRNDVFTPEREKLVKEIVAKTQFDLSVLLENVHDPHNVGAVLRTCDAVGVREIFILDTMPELTDRSFSGEMTTSRGVKHWLKIRRFTTLDKCITEIRKKYQHIITTHLNTESTPYYQYDLSESMCIAFGNEHKGISSQLLIASDGNIHIPQMGVVQSLNISVACAVTLFEACKQRSMKGKYDKNFDSKSSFHSTLFAHFRDLKTLKGKKNKNNV